MPSSVDMERGQEKQCELNNLRVFEMFLAFWRFLKDF